MSYGRRRTRRVQSQTRALNREQQAQASSVAAGFTSA